MIDLIKPTNSLWDKLVNPLLSDRHPLKFNRLISLTPYLLSIQAEKHIWHSLYSRTLATMVYFLFLDDMLSIIILGGSQTFCNILIHSCLQHVYQVTKVVQAIEGTHCCWYYHSSWCTDTLCIVSLCVI